jgi:hypothetical protein
MFQCLSCPSCPALSCPVMSCPVLPCPVLLCPVLSCLTLSCPILSCPVLSCPVLSYPALSCPALSWPVLPCPALSYPVLPCPVLSCPVLPCPSCPVLSCPVLSCPVLSCPVQSCPVLSCPHSADSCSAVKICIAHGTERKMKNKLRICTAAAGFIFLRIKEYQIVEWWLTDIKILCEVSPCLWVGSFRRFVSVIGSSSSKGQVVELEWIPIGWSLKMKAPRSFETSAPITQQRRLLSKNPL